MAKGELFSTVLRGFHKEQVTQYIGELVRKYEREKEELRKRWEAVNREKEQLRQQLDEQRQAAEKEEPQEEPVPAPACDNQKEETDLTRLRQLARQLSDQLDQARKREEAVRRESERILEAACIEGRTILNKAKEAGSEEQSALNRMREQLERDAKDLQQQKQAAQDVLAQAQQQAQQWKADAKRESEEVVNHAQEKAQQILAQAQEKAQQILAQAEDEKRRQVAQVQEQLQETKQQLGQMVGRMGNLSEELERFGDCIREQRADCGQSNEG